MSKTILISAIASLLGCWLSTASISLAHDWNAAGMYYGRGVHAYFSGRDDEAERYMTQAIESNPNDPRPYYFRAMSRLRQGRQSDARQDMEAGAAIEAQAPQRWGVGVALQRVQGRDRLVLEDYRRRARLDEAGRQDQRNRARYEQNKSREPEVLRHAVGIPLDELVQPGNPQELINSHVVPTQPTLLPGDSPPRRPEAGPPATPPQNPFADDPMPPADAKAKSTPDKPPTATESGAQDEDTLTPPPAEPTTDEQNNNGDSSSVDEENPFGF